MKNWEVRDIAIWQENTFSPSIRSQKMKSKLEAKEYFGANKQLKRGERIDYYITQCWLAYFKKDPDALMIIELMRMMPDWEDFQQGVNAKMEINLKRTWTNVRGEWRHVGED